MMAFCLDDDCNDDCEVNKRSHKTLLKWKIVKCEEERLFLPEVDPDSLVLGVAFNPTTTTLLISF